MSRTGARSSWLSVGLGIIALVAGLPSGSALAVPLPGGTLDPLTITKYVTPLVIPAVMHPVDPVACAASLTPATDPACKYDISVRQFQQQILPAPLPATRVWSYGPTIDPSPAVAPTALSHFNYPAYTIETTASTPVSVRWRNQLVVDPVACAASLTPATDPACNYLPHLLPVDQTLHWANPTGTGCTPESATATGTDCRTNNPVPYTGPVPTVVHLHGAHVDSHSDGFPEAWWLPAANNIPAGYVTEGSLYDDSLGHARGAKLGYADYQYRNDQAAATLWFHDHAMGMTRTNVYAGPAGFWLVRGGANDLPTGLPKPAPVTADPIMGLNTPGDPLRNSIREIPVVIQDRSFNADGSLFYPATRTFFDGYPGPFTGSTPISTDIAPIANVEAFFNTMVVNGVAWPKLEVAPAQYRLRLLNGCNSRMLNLALFVVDPVTGLTTAVELPFYQIGAEQGFLPSVAKVQTGTMTVYDGTPGGRVVVAPSAQQALLMGLAERADVLVDFRGLPSGTIVRMVNNGADAPFGGFPVMVPADPATTAQVMQFVVNATPASAGGPLGASPTDPVLADGVTPNPGAALDPTALALPAAAPLAAAGNVRNVSLNEEASAQVCVTVSPIGAITVVNVLPAPMADPAAFAAYCATLGAVPMAPKSPKLGTVDLTVPTAPVGVP
ncbi:MAG TPA: copper oxidase, partial [bacterium]